MRAMSNLGCYVASDAVDTNKGKTPSLPQALSVLWAMLSYALALSTTPAKHDANK